MLCNKDFLYVICFSNILDFIFKEISDNRYYALKVGAYVTHFRENRP